MPSIWPHFNSIDTCCGCCCCYCGLGQFDRAHCELIGHTSAALRFIRHSGFLSLREENSEKDEDDDKDKDDNADADDDDDP